MQLQVQFGGNAIAHTILTDASAPIDILKIYLSAVFSHKSAIKNTIFFDLYLFKYLHKAIFP